MGFDFFSWAIGVSLKSAIKYLFRDTLSRKINFEVNDWIRSLPPQLRFEADNLFYEISSSDDYPERAHLEILRKELRENHVPSREIWFNALFEQWNMVTTEHPRDGELEAFFYIDSEEAISYLNRLADRLENTCKQDETLFKVTIHDYISRIEDDINKIQKTLDKTLPNISSETIIEEANKQREQQLSLLFSDVTSEGHIIDKKYIPKLYINRKTVEAKFGEFLSSRYPVFALTGDAGMGKTNVLCNIAQKLKSEHAVLFYIGADLTGSITERLAAFLSGLIETHDIYDGLEQVSSVLKANAKSLFIFIDGINECSIGREKLRIELNQLLSEIGRTSIQLVITCRTLDWDFWIRNEYGMMGHFGRNVYSDKAFPSSTTAAQVGVGITIAEFDEQEFIEAWERYKQLFGLRGFLSPQMKELCVEPFMLRLVAEVYKNGKPIPNYIEPFELFDRYFDEKFASRKRNVDMFRFLYWTIDYILRRQEPRVLITDIVQTDMTLLDKLLDENVLVYRHGFFMHFHFELLLEFIAAKYILNLIREELYAEKTVSYIVGLVNNKLINMPGIIEIILIRLCQAEKSIVLECLRNLIKLDDKWKAIATSVIRKSSFDAEEIDDIVHTLASDNNYVIRFYLSQSLGSSIEKSDWHTIISLSNDSMSWEKRETAAYIIGHEAINNDVIVSVLVSQMDDFHWRVRRAAGYSFRQLILKGIPAAREFKERLYSDLCSLSWKVKYALSASLADSNGFNKADELTILSLAADPNRQVRWAIANYLPRYKCAAVQVIIDMLAQSNDPWIQAKLVNSLCRMIENGVDLDEIMVKLLKGSPKEVKISFARNAEKVRNREWVIPWLSNLLQDDRDAAFAAYYTLNVLDYMMDSPVTDADDMYLFMALRERIARRDYDPREARFSQTQQYIRKRTEFLQKNDPYMEIIDTICSLIAEAIEMIQNRKLSLILFLTTLITDVDEAVRWAVVVFLSEFSAKYIPNDIRYDCMSKLSNDYHWWVRREVATALGSFKASQVERDQAKRLISTMIENENKLNEDCKDEVLYFANASLESLSN